MFYPVFNSKGTTFLHQGVTSWKLEGDIKKFFMLVYGKGTIQISTTRRDASINPTGYLQVAREIELGGTIREVSNFGKDEKSGKITRTRSSFCR